MRRQELLIFALCCASSPLCALAQTSAPPRTAADQIRFSEPTLRAFDRSGAHVTLDRRPDGALHAHHHGSFQNVTVARIGPDGTVDTYCTTDEQHARRWMSGEDPRPAAGAVREFPGRLP